MKKFLIVSVVALAAVSVAVTAASASPAKSAAAGDICVLLPDTKSSVRWETQDRPRSSRRSSGRRHATAS